MPNTLWVLDVDGTVADNSHREGLIRCSSPDWDAFHSSELMRKDIPISSSLLHFESGRFRHGPFLYLTARPESTREVTASWLIQHGLATPETRILMKPDMIRMQPAPVFKWAALQVLTVEFPDHKLIMVDDHPGVLKALATTNVETRSAPDCWLWM